MTADEPADCLEPQTGTKRNVWKPALPLVALLVFFWGVLAWSEDEFDFVRQFHRMPALGRPHVGGSTLSATWYLRDPPADVERVVRANLSAENGWVGFDDHGDILFVQPDKPGKQLTLYAHPQSSDWPPGAKSAICISRPPNLLDKLRHWLRLSP